MYHLLFPQLLKDRWGEIKLDTYAELFFPEEVFPTNPLLDPFYCNQWLTGVHRLMQLDYSFGGYLEDRRHLWRGHYMKTEECVHLGVDYNVPEETLVSCPFDSMIIDVQMDPDQNGGWGGKITIKPDGQDNLFIFAHLSHHMPLHVHPNQHIAEGEDLGLIGGSHENGNWFPHLHLQCISREVWSKSAVEIDGYGKFDKRLSTMYPKPSGY